MSDSRSYRSGDWFGIFGEHVVVVLPPSEKSRVAALWALVDDGAGFDEVLDALISGGLRELPGFVLVSEAGEETRIVIRGAARAEFTTGDDTVTVEGSSATTWAEESLTGVRTMRIDVAESDGADDLALGVGLVRIARTDRPAYAAHRAEPVVAPVEEEQLEEEHVEEPVEEEPVEEETAFFAAPLVEEEVGQETALGDPPTSSQEPSLTEQAGWAQPSAPVAVPVAAPVAPADLANTGSTGERPSLEHDGHTQAGNWNPEDFARSQPGIPGQPPAPSVLAAPVAKLTFSSGEVVDVDRAVIVGRAPEARRFTSTEQPRLITVPSPNQEISSTHLEIRPGAGADHGSAVVTDLGSTNGTVLVQPGLSPEDLQPGIAVQLIPGAIIDLGDGVTIQVGHG